jgi:hypothetical protein
VLALDEVAMRFGKVSPGQDQLAALEKDVALKNFLLIAREPHSTAPAAQSSASSMP